MNEIVIKVKVPKNAISNVLNTKNSIEAQLKETLMNGGFLRKTKNKKTKKTKKRKLRYNRMTKQQQHKKTKNKRK